MRFQQNRRIRGIVRLGRTVVDAYKNAALVGQLCIVAQLLIRFEDILCRVCGKAGRTVDGKNSFWPVLTYKTLYRSSLSPISAHVFLRISSLCQVRADTNLGIEKFYFSIFVPLFEIVLRSGCCRGALFNPILTGYKSTPRLSIGKRPRSVACQGTPSMLHPVACPHGTKCCFVGKYATKTGIWAMKRIKSRRKMGTNEREINLDRARKESERHD